MTLAVILTILILNVVRRSTHYPETLSGIWDAPYTDLKLLDSLENEEFNAVQYGFPFAAFEYWWHRDKPSRVESTVLLGAFGNLFLLGWLLAAQRGMLRYGRKSTKRPSVCSVSSVANLREE